jgi:hypothetical protein
VTQWRGGEGLPSSSGCGGSAGEAFIQPARKGSEEAELAVCISDDQRVVITKKGTRGGRAGCIGDDSWFLFRARGQGITGMPASILHKFRCLE